MQSRGGRTRRSGRERVAAIQRARIVAAMLEVCAERGAASLSVAPVVQRAGVSRRTFYELFKDTEDCLLAAVDDGIERIAAAVVPAWREDGSWRERVRASLTELLHTLDGDPVTGRLLLVETLGAGHEALERRQRVVAHLIAAVDRGREGTKNGHHASSLTAEGVVGGVMSVLHRRLIDGTERSLLGLTGPLMSLIVLPYLGPAAARKELERPAPKGRRKRVRAASPATEDPLREIGMRLTHRTVLVLGAIAESPGASNRQVGRSAGIDDQGQISKLLARLRRFGLIRNDADGDVRGAPNAWTLTDTGERVHDVMSPLEAHGQERWYRGAPDGA